TSTIELLTTIPASIMMPIKPGMLSGRPVTNKPSKTPTTVVGNENMIINGNKKFSNRSEEHTSELQSRFDLVCRLLLEKKKKTPYISPNDSSTTRRRRSTHLQSGTHYLQ